MRVAVVGSRSIEVANLKRFLPKDTTEIVSGGAKGVDTQAREYALAHNLKLTEFLPEYEKYGRGAPLKRNITIIENADLVVAFWDGVSRGTKFVIEECNKRGKPIQIFGALERTPEELDEYEKPPPLPKWDGRPIYYLSEWIGYPIDWTWCFLARHLHKRKMRYRDFMKINYSDMDFLTRAVKLFFDRVAPETEIEEGE